MVPMRDGIRLATDIYLPQGKGPFPTILSRTPYGRRLGVGSSVGPFLNAGYAVVIQDMRGRFDSEGKAFVFSTDQRDGHDTVAWIAKQPWSNGKVGTYGPSALGIAQYALAPNAPPALQCMFVLVATSNPAKDGFYQGGVFRLGLVAGWLVRTGLSRDHLAHVYSKSPETLKLMRHLIYITQASQVHIPILHVGGWFDIFTKGILDTFTTFQTQGGKGARGKQKLIIGPWNHGVGGNRAGSFTFPENAALSLDPVDWFDRCLKKEKGGIDPIPTVRYYEMGALGEPGAPGNEWKSAKSWPVPTETATWYFHKDGLLNQQKPEEKEAERSYLFDPEDYVPTICGAELTLRPSPCDVQKLTARPDVLTFTTLPLKRPVAITGKVKVTLYIRSQAKDTDFTAWLTDVYPDGRTILIADGIQRARFRQGILFESLLDPDKITPLTIEVGSTSLVFNRGHRIRLLISSSNFPRFLINPNTGGDLKLSPAAIDHIYQFGLSQEYEPALIYSKLVPTINTLELNSTYPSKLQLPTTSL